MPGFMFQDVVCSKSDSTRKWFTLPLSFAIHTVALIVFVVVPLVAVDKLPTPRFMLAYTTPPAIPAPPPPAPIRHAEIERLPAAEANPNAAPLDAPSGIKSEPAFIAEPEMRSGLAGVIEGLPIASAVEAAPPPPPVTEKLVRPGGDVKLPIRVRDVAPIYPPIALSARVQGEVIIDAVIGVDGRVRDARVLRSIPLLDKAALDAVYSWIYTPTLLNGQPVSVVMTVTVRFRLN